MRWIIGAILASIYFFTPDTAKAWGEGGHYTVCAIAYLNLTPAAKANVDRLVALNGRFPGFVETCTFPDNPVSRASEHYSNYARTDRRVRPGCPGGRPCVITALETDLAILRSNDWTAEQKSTSMLYIGHWFGDLHQPLHISFADDRGGNSVLISGVCPAGRYPGSLHSVWDSCVVENRILAPGTDRVARARAAAPLLDAAITDGQRRNWVRSAPWQWAAESYKVTLSGRTGYCIRKSGACWYSAAKREFAEGDTQRTVVVDDAYLDRAKPIVEARLRRAGIRLAHALNRTFDPAYRGFGR